MSTSDWTSEFCQLIEDCTNRSDRLTEWEMGFIESMEHQIASGRRPTAKQVEWLDTIWERATSRG